MVVKICLVPIQIWLPGNKLTLLQRYPYIYYIFGDIVANVSIYKDLLKLYINFMIPKKIFTFVNICPKIEVFNKI